LENFRELIKAMQILENFRRYLQAKVELSDSEFDLIWSKSKGRKIAKREFYLREGEVSQYNTFVVKGLLRLYRIDEEGNEHIMRFAPENWWISDRESYNTGKPSKFIIDALEKSEVLIWTKEDTEFVYGRIPAFRAFGEGLFVESFIAYHNRIYNTISSTAEEKYENFVKTYPDIFNRVPLHMVASYLGVTRETLSRVRRNYTLK
jgi:CRP-like cAMP-binding protein